MVKKGISEADVSGEKKETQARLDTFYRMKQAEADAVSEPNRCLPLILRRLIRYGEEIESLKRAIRKINPDIEFKIELDYKTRIKGTSLIRFKTSEDEKKGIEAIREPYRESHHYRVSKKQLGILDEHGVLYMTWVGGLDGLHPSEIFPEDVDSFDLIRA